MTNGGTNDAKPDSNKSVIFVVILTVAICTILGVITFSFSMIVGGLLAVASMWNGKPPPPELLKPEAVIVTAFSSIITACLGYLAGVLSKTSPTETTKHVDLSTPPTLTDADTPALPPKT